MASVVEQSDRGYVDLKGGDEGIGDLLEGGDEVVAGNGGDRLLQARLPPFALLEEMPGANLVGDVDRERDHDGAPAVGVDAVEGCAPPARLLPRGVVTELGQVTRPSGRGYFCDECRQLSARRARLAFVVVRFDQLVERQVVIGETGQRGVGVEDLERLGVVDEQADRQVGVEFLQQEQVGGVRVRARPATAARFVLVEALVRGRTGRRARSLRE